MSRHFPSLELSINTNGYAHFNTDDLKPSRCAAITNSLYKFFVKTPISSVYSLCKFSLEWLQAKLETHPNIDHRLVVVCASASGVIAWSSPAVIGGLFMSEPYVIPSVGGNIISLICSLLANIALLLSFRLSENIKLTLRARDRINKMHGGFYWTMELIWFYLFLNYVLESVAQGELTAANWAEQGLALEIPFFILGWAGFTLSRSAAIARVLFLLILPEDEKQPINMINIGKKIQALVGRKHNLPKDEQTVDMLGNLLTFSLLIADFFVVFNMYSLKILKALRRMGIDICSRDPTCLNVSPAAYWVSIFSSVLNFIFFYFPLQNSLGSAYSYTKSANNFLQHKNWPKPVAWGCIGFSQVVLLHVGRNSIGGLLTPNARGPANLTATTVLMMFVNTTPALKELAKKLKEETSDTGNPLRSFPAISHYPEIPRQLRLLSSCSSCCFFGEEEKTVLIIGNPTNFNLTETTTVYAV